MFFSEMAGGHEENSGPGPSFSFYKLSRGHCEAAEGGGARRGGEIDREASLKL